MGHLNVEIKAWSVEHERIKALLQERHADFRGIDHQIDTYFNTRQGRLKLREGTIEQNLIYYERENTDGPKDSKVILYHFDGNRALKEILTKAMGVLTVVDKQREIYFIENVKFHLDTVVDLGRFVEIEAISEKGAIQTEKLQEQCEYYKKLLEIKDEDLIGGSYIDMLIEKMESIKTNRK